MVIAKAFTLLIEWEAPQEARGGMKSQSWGWILPLPA